MADNAKMDYFYSVFNGHINNASDRAMKQLRDENPAFADEMQPFIDSGVMAIFDKDPTPATKRYVQLVMEFVNENRE